jgi:cytochrome c oxidase assembly factor CtaG
VWVWTFDPTELAPIVLAAALYARRVATLHSKGRPPSWWKPACFLAGLTVAALAVVSPIDALGEDRSFTAHMIQHLMLGDLAPLLCVAGLSGPILRPVLALPLVGRLRVLIHPLRALPIWAFDLALWHLPGAYQLALRNDTIHAIEHTCFFVGGALLWGAILEPLPGPAWFGSGAKALYILAVRGFDTLLAFVFVWSHTVFYPYYSHVAPLWGMSPIEDQNLGGIAMLAEGSIVTITAFLWLLWRWLSDGELTTELVEAGIPEHRAQRAVRYGRGTALAEMVGRSRSGAPAAVVHQTAGPR